MTEQTTPAFPLWRASSLEEAVNETAKALVSLAGDPIVKTYPYEPGVGVLGAFAPFEDTWPCLAMSFLNFGRVGQQAPGTPVPGLISFSAHVYYPIVEYDEPGRDGYKEAQLRALSAYSQWDYALFENPRLDRRVQSAQATSGRTFPIQETGLFLMCYEADVEVRLH